MSNVKLYTGLLRDVKRKMDAGLAKPSMSATMLEEQETSGLTEIQMAYSASAPFTAGIPTVRIAHFPSLFLYSPQRGFPYFLDLFFS